MRRSYLVDLIPAANDGLGFGAEPAWQEFGRAVPGDQAGSNQPQPSGCPVGSVRSPCPAPRNLSTSVYGRSCWLERRGGRIGSNGPDDRDLLVPVGGLVIVHSAIAGWPFVQKGHGVEAPRGPLSRGKPGRETAPGVGGAILFVVGTKREVSHVRAGRGGRREPGNLGR